MGLVISFYELIKGLKISELRKLEKKTNFNYLTSGHRAVSIEKPKVGVRPVEIFLGMWRWFLGLRRYF